MFRELNLLNITKARVSYRSLQADFFNECCVLLFSTGIREGGENKLKILFKYQEILLECSINWFGCFSNLLTHASDVLGTVSSKDLGRLSLNDIPQLSTFKIKL